LFYGDHVLFPCFLFFCSVLVLGLLRLVMAGFI